MRQCVRLGCCRITSMILCSPHKPLWAKGTKTCMSSFCTKKRKDEGPCGFAFNTSTPPNRICSFSSGLQEHTVVVQQTGQLCAKSGLPSLVATTSMINETFQPHGLLHWRRKLALFSNCCSQPQLFFLELQY